MNNCFVEESEHWALSRREQEGLFGIGWKSRTNGDNFVGKSGECVEQPTGKNCMGWIVPRNCNFCILRDADRDWRGTVRRGERVLDPAKRFAHR